MLLHALLRQYDRNLSLSGIPNEEVSGVHEDSRRVTAGSLFVARDGKKTDGAVFVADAKARGAVAVVCQAKIPNCPLPCIIVPHAGAAASLLANLYAGSPSATMRVFGVTGTNGKTTTTYVVRHLLAKVSQRCGLIGTVEIDNGRTRREAQMTTPAACDIADLLSTMRDKGCRAVAMEVSSHALDQGRVAGVQFSGAAFTNLTGDHLDYHDTMEKYAAAKAQLFSQLDAEAVAVVNADDESSDCMIQDCCSRIIRFGFGKKADYRARDIAVTASGTHFILHTPDGRAQVTMPMIGRHNIENVLAAAALVGETCGLSVHQIARGLSDCHGAPGRLQPVRAGQPFAVLVDYAHTDDALENVLSSLRPLCRKTGRLRVLFGCGGDRDRSKRPRMAKIAEKLADEIYITSDNPRNEDPQKILQDIVSGLSEDTEKLVCVETDRRLAIQRVLSDAAPGDIVLIAGKGHENYQILGEEKHPFDDVAEAMRVLQQKTAA